MLTLSDLVWFALAVAAVNYWWRARGFKSQALQVAWRHCQASGVQLLDQTVVMKGVKIQRSPAGSLQLQRRYEFEFTSTGEQRYKGLLVLAGRVLERIEMEPYLMPDSFDADHHLH